MANKIHRQVRDGVQLRAVLSSEQSKQGESNQDARRRAIQARFKNLQLAKNGKAAPPPPVSEQESERRQANYVIENAQNGDAGVREPFPHGERLQAAFNNAGMSVD